MERVCKGAKEKPVSQDGVDVCRGEPERDEKKLPEEIGGGVELKSGVGREESVQDNAPRALNLSVAKSSTFLTNLLTKMAQILECPLVECVWYRMLVAHGAKKPNRFALGCCRPAECEVWKQAAAPAGQFLAAFVGVTTYPAGAQMFAAVGIQVSEADFSEFLVIQKCRKDFKQ